MELATLGARLFKPAHRSVEVGSIIIADYDFPKPMICLLQYEDDAFGKKSFAYTTPPLQPLPTDLANSSLLRAQSFHFLAQPGVLERNIAALLCLRQEHGILERPLLVWGPSPLGCDSADKAGHLKPCKIVDVFSPNHLELSYLIEGKGEVEPAFSRETVEAQA
ncbi:hypothetical protein RRF57_006081 [Xylaria bambusicola]|uniref:Uncharacterized protein n=1 Tax=Xylaria bambusicola TaxID=326684 RepID=A0AAN7Z9M2_9PEZI